MTETQTTGNPVTPKQVAFILTLLAEREGYSEGFDERVRAGIATFAMTRQEASNVITWLMERPKKAGVKKSYGPPLDNGLYVVGPDGEWSSYWLVRTAKGSGNKYAMRLASTPVEGSKLNWEFVPSGLRDVRRSRPGTAAEAAALGHQTHFCCFCGLQLTDEGEGKSVEVGYGPICAGNNGLPWGVKTPE